MPIGDFANAPIMEMHEEVFIAEDGTETVITEGFNVKVNSKGEKTKRKTCPKGYKLSPDGKSCVKVNAKEKMNRSKSAKKGAKKRVSKQRQINRKTQKAMKKRKSMGM